MIGRAEKAGGMREGIVEMVRKWVVEMEMETHDVGNLAEGLDLQESWIFTCALRGVDYYELISNVVFLETGGDTPSAGGDGRPVQLDNHACE